VPNQVRDIGGITNIISIKSNKIKKDITKTWNKFHVQNDHARIVSLKRIHLLKQLYSKYTHFITNQLDNCQYSESQESSNKNH